MKLQLLILFPFYLLPVAVHSQDTNTDTVKGDSTEVPANFNSIYNERIASAHLRSHGSEFADAVISTLPTSKLQLRFDDLGEDYRDYVFELVHCDINWNPVNTDSRIFFEGLVNNLIEEVEFSSGTKAAFAHYQILLPGEGQRFLRSGNYLIHIRDEESGQYVLTRRFAVVRAAVTSLCEAGRPGDVSTADYRQQLQFEIADPKSVIADISKLQPVIIKNASWEILCGDMKPSFVSNGIIHFDNLDMCTFDGGNEYRSFNMLEYKNLSMNIVRTEFLPGGFKEFWLETDKARSHLRYTFIEDRNGKMHFGEYSNSILPTELDYVYVNFTLSPGMPMLDQNIYLFGELTNYRLDEKYKMNYDAGNDVYRLRSYLKQGHYNYQYVVKSLYSEGPDEAMIEGSYFETGNDYTVLIYYSNVFEGYDELLGICRINSIKK